MIQFNLLPDVKKKYIKAKRQKRIIFTVSTFAAGASLALVLIMFSIVQIAQKKNINDLTKDIKTEISSIQSINDLNKILTIQNQLTSLPALHASKPEASRLFAYLNQLTPADVKISSVKINFEENTISIEGSAPSLASINRYADTLKFTGFTGTDVTDETASENTNEVVVTEISIKDLTDANKAFKDVTTELSRNEERSTYTIKATFNPTLFDNTKNVVLSIPEKTITTRSTLGKPNLGDQSDNSLFEDKGGNN